VRGKSKSLERMRSLFRAKPDKLPSGEIMISCPHCGAIQCFPVLTLGDMKKGFTCPDCDHKWYADIGHERKSRSYVARWFASCPHCHTLIPGEPIKEAGEPTIGFKCHDCDDGFYYFSSVFELPIGLPDPVPDMKHLCLECGRTLNVFAILKENGHTVYVSNCPCGAHSIVKVDYKTSAEDGLPIETSYFDTCPSCARTVKGMPIKKLEDDRSFRITGASFRCKCGETWAVPTGHFEGSLTVDPDFPKDTGDCPACRKKIEGIHIKDVEEFSIFHCDCGAKTRIKYPRRLEEGTIARCKCGRAFDPMRVTAKGTGKRPMKAYTCECGEKYAIEEGIHITSWTEEEIEKLKEAGKLKEDGKHFRVSIGGRAKVAPEVVPDVGPIPMSEKAIDVCPKCESPGIEGKLEVGSIDDSTSAYHFECKMCAAIWTRQQDADFSEPASIWTTRRS